MKTKKIYSMSPELIQELIERWEEYKEYSYGALDKLNHINNELIDFINNRGTISDGSYKRLKGFRRVNNSMSIYTTKLSAYLKQIDTGITVSFADDMTLKQLRAILDEALEWRKDYNIAISDYKALQAACMMQYYKDDGTFDIAGWLE